MLIVAMASRCAHTWKQVSVNKHNQKTNDHAVLMSQLA